MNLRAYHVLLVVAMIFYLIDKWINGFKEIPMRKTTNGMSGGGPGEENPPKKSKGGPVRPKPKK